MTRPRDERGATAVVVAVMLIVLVGFGALAVDMGAFWWDRKQLQNGADAAALALAQECVKQGTTCQPYEYECGLAGEYECGLAGEYARGNKLDDKVTVTKIKHHDNTIRVDVASVRQHWLAPVIGINSSTIPASATASWGGIRAATVLPIAIQMCTTPTMGDPLHIVVRDQQGNPCDKGEGSPGHYAPGNWGWLKPGDDCLIHLDAGGHAVADEGSNTPKGCDAELAGLAGQESVLLPIFDTVSKPKNDTLFHVIGFVSIKVTSYCLSNSNSKLKANVNPPHTPKCQNANDRWVLGEFVEFLDLNAEIGGPNFGSTTVQLTN